MLISKRVRRLAAKFASEFGVEVTPDELWEHLRSHYPPTIRTVLIWDALVDRDVLEGTVDEYLAVQRWRNDHAK